MTGQYLSGKRTISYSAERTAPDERMLRIVEAYGNNLKNVTLDLPVGLADLRDGRVRLGQVDAHQRHALSRGRAASVRLGDRAGAVRGDRRARTFRQGDRRRSIADRPHAALESGHLHRPLHADPRTVRGRAGGEGARLRSRPLLVQREGRALRSVPGRRRAEGRNALSARRLRARATSATASATTAKRSKSSTRARTSAKCST